MLFFPHPSSETWNDEEYECDVHRGCANKRLPHISLMSGYYNWQEREREKTRGGRVGEPAWRRGVPRTGAGGDSPATREDPNSKARLSLFSSESHCLRARTHSFTHTYSHTHTHYTHVLRLFWMKLHSRRVWRHQQLLLMHWRHLGTFFFNNFWLEDLWRQQQLLKMNGSSKNKRSLILTLTTIWTWTTTITNYF